MRGWALGLLVVAAACDSESSADPTERVDMTPADASAVVDMAGATDTDVPDQPVPDGGRMH